MKSKILAVDDEIHMLKLLKRVILEKTSYQITTTNNSLEVPEILENEQFDIIITDVRMRGLDGWDVLKLVTEGGRSEEVIIITAFGSAETTQQALDLGAFDYLIKPFHRDEFLFTLKRALHFHKSKLESASLLQPYGIEPFAKADEMFKREYIRRLAAKESGDVQSIAERLGLSEVDIRSALKDDESI